jgi:F420-dependent oxidoreductase-like protein
MRISTNLDYAGDFQASAARAVALEQAGVDAIWVAEAYGFDAISMLGYLAAKTERVTLGTGIINVFSRTPALIAQTAAGLDRLTEGRFVLGLGASGPQVIEGWHGMAYTRPIARLRETIDICRMAWARERLVYDGSVFTLPLPADQGTGLGKPLKMINTPQRAHIPIHIASLGPKSVEICAASADGWLPFLYVPERADRVWGTALAKGLANRPPELAPLEITGGGILAIGAMADVGVVHRRHGRARQELLHRRVPCVRMGSRGRAHPGPLPRGQEGRSGSRGARRTGREVDVVRGRRVRA